MEIQNFPEFRENLSSQERPLFGRLGKLARMEPEYEWFLQKVVRRINKSIAKHYRWNPTPFPEEGYRVDIKKFVDQFWEHICSAKAYPKYIDYYSDTRATFGDIEEFMEKSTSCYDKIVAPIRRLFLCQGYKRDPENMCLVIYFYT